MEDNFSPNTFALQVDNSNIPYLNEAAKWGKFLSILGFIVIAILLICGLLAMLTGNTLSSSELNTDFQNFQLSGNTAGIIVGIYILVVAILYFFPCFYLYNFSAKLQVALRNNDQINLNNSFRHLKSLFKFWGILTIIMICIWALALILSVILGSIF